MNQSSRRDLLIRELRNTRKLTYREISIRFKLSVARCYQIVNEPIAPRANPPEYVLWNGVKKRLQQY